MSRQAISRVGGCSHMEPLDLLAGHRGKDSHTYVDLNKSLDWPFITKGIYFYIQK